MTDKIKQYFLTIEKGNEFEKFYNPELNEIDLKRLPNSQKEANTYSGFWSSFIGEFSKEVSEMSFSYGELKKQPLTKFQKIQRFLGKKIETQEVEEDIKEKTIRPVYVSEMEGLAKIVSEKEEWTELNRLSKKTKDFSSTYVLALEPLCYKSQIPLEIITRIKLGKAS